MVIGDAKVDSSITFGSPTGKLLSIGNSLVKEVNRASPDMEILQAMCWLASSTEDVHGGEPILRVGDSVEEVHGIVHGVRPESGISHVRPVNGGMHHHGSGDGHDGSDGSLSNGIVMVCTGSSKVNDLSIFLKLLLECLGCEGRTTVTQVLGGYHTMFKAHGFKLLDSVQSFRGCETLLHFNMNCTTGQVNEQAATCVAGSIDTTTTVGGDSLG